MPRVSSLSPSSSRPPAVLYLEQYTLSRHESPSPMSSGLQSPIVLREPTFKRRGRTLTPRRTRHANRKHPYTAPHRTHPSNNECPFDSRPLNVFDDVPWIAALESPNIAAMESKCFSDWDIPSFCHLTADDPIPASSGPGTPHVSEIIDDERNSLSARIPFPFALERCYSPRPSSQQVHHSQIIFRHLMPTYPPRCCTTQSGDHE